MTRSKTISTIFALAGAGLLAWAGVSWHRYSEDVNHWTGKLDEHQSQLKATQTEVQSLSLQYQAFMKSMPAVPDSVKISSGPEMRATERRYESTIHKLERTEMTLGLDINRAKRKLAEAEQTRKRAAIPFAGGGAAAWLCAALVAGLARKPRKAA